MTLNNFFIFQARWVKTHTFFPNSFIFDFLKVQGIMYTEAVTNLCSSSDGLFFAGPQLRLLDDNKVFLTQSGKLIDTKGCPQTENEIKKMEVGSTK